MRTVRVAALGRDVPVLGFGCASLGSRISASKGERALAIAWEHGVRWFDVAPPYGDGEAERLLGRFLRGGKRDEAIICTKFGLDRPSISFAKRIARPFARALIDRVPALRQRISTARPTGQRAPLDPASAMASVEESLRRLGTDHVDVLALHEATPREAADPALRDVLASAVEMGRARATSVASTPDAVMAGLAADARITICQFPDTPFTRARDRVEQGFRGRTAPTYLTHGVFGGGTLQRFSVLAQGARDEIAAIAVERGYGGDSPVSALLMDYALSANARGSVLASMFSGGHIAANATIAGLAPDPRVVELVRRIIDQQA